MRAALLLPLLVAGCIRSPADIPPLPESPQITGTLVERDPRSGQLRPVPAAQVKLVEGSFATSSLEDGFFMLGDLPLGVHGLDLSRGERFGRPVAARRLTGLRVETEVSLDLGNVELGGVGDLTGEVRLADVEELASGAAGSIATVVGTAFSAVVDLRGEFLLAGVPEGEFVVAVYRPGYFPQERGLVPVTKNLVSTVRPYLLERDPNATPVPVAGAVVVEGDPGGVLVTIEDEVRTSTPTAYDPGMTDSSGEYVVSVPPGVYRIKYEKEGFRSAELRGVAVLSAEDIAGLSTVYLGAGEGPEGDPDGDGCAEDAFPNDPLECADADGDGEGDGADPDDDNDDLFDVEEVSPGLDGWITDPTNADTDGDSVPDPDDICPVHADPGQEDADGDGIGDACDFGVTGPGPGVDAPPTIIGFTPEAAPFGALVIIDGADFNPVSALNLVRFGPNSFAVTQPEPSSTGTQLRVRVPVGAESGLISVSNGFGTTLSVDAFTLLPGPVVTDVQPRRVAPGGTVTLTGSELDGAEVVVAGSTLASTPGNPPETSLSFTAPTTPGSYTIRLRRLGGESVAPHPLVVWAGPQIVSVQPNPVAIGQVLSIFGSDLVGDDPNDTEVEISGLLVTPDHLASQVIRLTVPSGAVSGSVTVRNLVSGQTASAPLTIDPMLPVVEFQSHLIAEEGATVTLSGLNLEGATDVTVGGAAATFTSMPGLLLVEVPVGAPAGEVLVTVPTPAGDLQVAAPDDLSVMRFVNEVADQAKAFGFHDNGNIYSVERLAGQAVGRTYDPSLTLLPGQDVPLPPSVGFPATTVVQGMSIAQTGAPRRGVISTLDRSYAITVPGFVSTGSCDVRLTTAYATDGTSGWSFSDDGTTAFSSTVDTFVIFDLVAGTCDIVDPGFPLSFAMRPTALIGQTRVVLTLSQEGFGIYDWSTQTMVQPFTPGAGAGVLFGQWYTDATNQVWGTSPVAGLGNAGQYDPTTGALLADVGHQGTTSAHSVMTADRRFIFIDDGALWALDTEKKRVALPDMPGVRGESGIAWDAQRSRLLVRGSLAGMSRMRLFEVDLAP